MACARSSDRAFLVAATLLFAASAAVTVAWCRSMSGMGETPMPGGWTLSTAWAPMCGQGWTGAAVSFVAMWTTMMAAMMLPSLVSMLARYRAAVGHTDAARLDVLTALAAAGYLTVWAALGAIVFGLGATMAALLMERPELAHGGPLAAATVVLLAGALQFTRWKRRRLARCRGEPAAATAPPAAVTAALRHGVGLGLDCTLSCAGPTASLLVLGVMDLRVMAAVTTAVTLERVAPRGERVAWASGAVAIAAGLLLMGQAIGAG